MSQTQTDEHGLPTTWTPKRTHRTARISPPPFPGLRQRNHSSYAHRIARLIFVSVVPE